MSTETRVWWIVRGDEGYQRFHKETLAWVEGLGLNPDELLPEAEVAERDGIFEFHADELVRDDAGKPQMDPNVPDAVLTRHVVVPVEPNTWPTMPYRATV